VNRSGSNRSGSGQKRSSRCRTCPTRHEPAADVDLLDRQTAHGPGGRIEPHRFGEDHLDELQSWEIRCSRQPAIQHFADHAVHPGFDVRVLRQQIPRPAQRVRCRLVSRQEDRHRFVANLLIAHRTAVALDILTEEEHGEQVATVFPGCSPIIDDGIDRSIQPVDRRAEAPARRKRQFLQERSKWIHQQRKELDQLAESRGDLVLLSLHVGFEERARNDRQGEAHHLLMDVQRLSVAPLLPQGGSLVDHDPGITGDSIAVKAGLHQASLPPV